MKNVVLLGSTGSIGTSTVKVAEDLPDRIRLVALAAGKSVTTIEGLGRDGLHAVQQAWVELNTPQCGYCQPGQIMSAAALQAVNAAPSDADIDVAMAGNLCRCGTYARIRKAIHRAADLLAAQQAESALETVPPAEEVEP